jgi:hypothetical protein
MATDESSNCKGNSADGVIVPPLRVRSREISDHDLTVVADLLLRGFGRRTRSYWSRALDRLTCHNHAIGTPKYGYLMEFDSVAVGVILLISSMVPKGNGWTTRCNVSSWYVEPGFRSQAPLLVTYALRSKEVTYLNISPALHTLPILEAQGFSRYCDGQFATVPGLGRAPTGPRARLLGAHAEPDVHFDPFERQLLLAHAEYGCLSFWCVTAERAYPFIFRPRVVKGVVPCVQLIYSRNIEDFVRFAGQIGRFLALRGRPLVLIDANGPIRGLAGKYFDGISPKFFKGPERPRLGDLAYTEAAMFGV